MKPQAINKLIETKPSYLMFGMVELAVAYGFACLAIDSGGLWWYGLTFVFLVSSLVSLLKVFRGQDK
ncbi:MAG: hypothetical protein ABI220_00980 [Candidatus Saccharimonadales bacterium]